MFDKSILINSLLIFLSVICYYMRLCSVRRHPIKTTHLRKPLRKQTMTVYFHQLSVTESKMYNQHYYNIRFLISQVISICNPFLFLKDITLGQGVYTKLYLSQPRSRNWYLVCSYEPHMCQHSALCNYA